jgi:hypothetical protein
MAGNHILRKVEQFTLALKEATSPSYNSWTFQEEYLLAQFSGGSPK